MMISEVEKKTDEIMSVVIDMNNNKLIPTEEAEAEEEHASRVCVCRVPKTLSSSKPEAFTPQFVGLGPYHHTRSDLTMTDELKLAAAKRILKHAFQIRISHVQLFYHQDAFISSHSNLHNLVRHVTIDALVLLALLHRSADASRHHHSYFLTGKHGLPLVNALGVELTIDAVIADVFMLENQIPARFLQQVNANDEIEVQNYNLGMKMKSFCEKYCPLAKLEKLRKNPEKHDHLLDLMYNLIVQEKDENIKEDNGNNQHGDFDFFFGWFDFLAQVKSCRMCGCAGRCLSESDGEDENENENDEEEGKRSRTNACSSMCSLCSNIWLGFIVLFLLFLWFFYVCMPCLWDFIRRLPTLFIRALLSLYDLLKYISDRIHPAVNRLHSFLLNHGNQNQLRPCTLLVDGIKRASEEFMGDSTNSDSGPLVLIPSATELQKAGIGFKPAGGGISSIEFNEGSSMFSLPVMKLDVNSEVIMRNLVAYESLTDSNKELVFTRYIELMKDIIKNGHDVKVLVNRKIIGTELSEEDVAEVFNGMNKVVRATNCKDLEEVIKKVNGKFDDSQKVKRALIKYVYSAGKFYTVVAALAFLALTAMQAYCSVYSCSATSKNATMPPPNEDYHKNNYFVSSL